MYFKSVWDPGAFRDLDFTPRGEIIYRSPQLLPLLVSVSFLSLLALHTSARHTCSLSESRSTRSFHSALKMGRGLFFFFPFFSLKLHRQAVLSTRLRMQMLYQPSAVKANESNGV